MRRTTRWAANLARARGASMASGLEPATTRWDVAEERIVVAGSSPPARGRRRPAGTAVMLLAVCLLAGCRQDMHDQPSYKPYRSSSFFADGRASRPLPPDTVARGQLREDVLLHTGKTGEQFASELPRPISAATLKRGQERYNVYCSPCHDQTGGGNGMIVQRGYRRPTSFHDPRLRQQPVGYFFDVISKGFGVMPSYAQQTTADDRWAIVAYIRALQLSHNATVADVPAADMPQLSAPAAAPPGAHHE